MEKNKSLVEDTILQIKNLEDLVAENAQGILSTTMSKEISELVKESLKEQDDDVEDEIEDTDVEMDDTEMEDDEMDSEEEVDIDTDNFDMDMDMDMSDEPVIDMTGEENPDEVLRVFQLMGPDDEIVVKKDDSGNINLKDNKNNTEYMIVGESEEDDFDMDFSYEDDEDDVTDIIDKAFSSDEMDESWEEEEEEVVYEMEDEEEEEEEEIVYEVEMDDEELEESWNEEEEEEEEIVYEIEMDEEEEMDFEDDDEDMEMENYDLDSVMESMSVKPKGSGIGKPKFKYDAKPNQGQGFKTKMKQGPKTMGTGKAKFEYKEGENSGDKLGKNKMVKKTETKEASRTYGNGSKSGRGLRKAITPNRNLTFENTNNKEVQILREKNEEYRKALNLFRDKLNEVAVFNSNLAYATRLFTEHTTTKQEKINILKRFDDVQSIKESKNLYRTIKQELGSTTSKPMNESMDRALNSTPTNGSAVNLIESKTYENPQFMRMKDLMSKLK